MSRYLPVSSRRLTLCAVAASLLALPALSGSVQAAPNATEIMKKSAATHASIRTYKATMQTTSSFGGRSSSGMQEIAMVPSSGKIRMTMTQNMMGRIVKTIVVDDGKTMYSYTPQSKSYMKMPHRKNMAQRQLDPMAAFKAAGATYKYVRSASIGGRPMHVIQVMMNPQMMPRMGSSTMLMYIDQGTYRMKQMEIKSSFQGPDKKTNSMTMKTVVVSETINVPIPASTFQFTPPPGAREMKTPSGFPGMPRRGMNRPPARRG